MFSFRSVLVMLAFGWLSAGSSLHAQSLLFSQVDASSPPSTLAMLDSRGPERLEPMFGVEVGYLTLQRSKESAYTIALSDGLNGPVRPVASSSVLDPEFIGGYQVAINFYNLTRYVSALDSELEFFGVDGTAAEATVSAADHNSAVLYPAFFGAYPSDPVGANTFTLNSDLDSAEWNLGYRPCGPLRLLVGLRWLELKEQFDIVDTATRNSRVIEGFFSNASNEAFGVQIGGEATLWTNGTFRLFSSAKYAFLENEVRGKAVAANAQIGFDDSVDTSLLDIELGVTANIFRYVDLQLVYQGLFLQDAGTLINQSRDLQILNGNGQRPTFDRVQWNGLQFGAIITI